MSSDFRIGRVSSVDAKAHTARVTFEDVPDLPMVSGDLQVLVTRQGDYSLPAVNALVLCAMFPGSTGGGAVLGAFYSEADVAPLSDAAKRSIASDDLRLGSPTATDKVALAPLADGELDKIKQAYSGVTLVVIGTCPPGGGPLSGGAVKLPTYEPESVAAEKVSAK